MSGILYLVATPIGNLEDITLRALRILKEVDIIAAEDTRHSGQLLAHYEIKKPLISYYEHNKRLRESELLAHLAQGKDIALITDAGTPALSDPGAELAAAALDAGFTVTAIPGASALLTALAMSGRGGAPFCFEGFLPRRAAERRQRLRELAGERRLLIFYEAPHRLRATLDDMAQELGGERRITVCRELTKLHEQQSSGSLTEICRLYAEQEPRGEFVLLLSGAEAQPLAIPDEDALRAEMAALLAQGIPRKDAARMVAGSYGLRVRDVYALGLSLDKNVDE